MGGAIFNNGSAHISDCTFSGNLAGTGGAILNNSDHMIINNCVFRENKAEEGGAVSNTASLSIDCSAFLENSANLEGGAFQNQSGTATITNCTFALNTAKYEGGAIWHGPYGGADGIECISTLTHVTIAYNSAQRSGGGIFVRVKRKRQSTFRKQKVKQSIESIPNSICNVRNSIIVGNTIQDCAGVAGQNINNLVGDGSWQSAWADDPLLGKLLSSPPVFPLRKGSPAINAAHPDYCLPEDQIGTSRPQGTLGDIGAYEHVQSEQREPARLKDLLG